MDEAQCLEYALANNPDLQNARLEDSLARLNNAIALAAWKPSVALTAGLTNNWKQQVSIFPDFNNPGETREVILGQPWTSAAGLTLNQLIYSPEVIRDRNLRAANVRAAGLLIETRELELKAAVKTAFYRTLRFSELVKLRRADIERLERNLRDARLFYEEGIVDKVDYKRATIALNQARADLATSLLTVVSRKAELKALMGYPGGETLALRYDYDAYTAEVLSDSVIELELRERPEVRALAVRQNQQDISVSYLQNAWYPTVGASAGYTYNWVAQNFGDLYARSFPAGVVGLNVSVPLFDGARRFRRVEAARVERLGLDYELTAVRQQIEREYTVAENTYRAGRLNYLVADDNVALAREIYDVIRLQYREGIEPFLEVIIAENDLRTSQNAALNALIDALIAKVELERVTATL